MMWLLLWLLLLLLRDLAVGTADEEIKDWLSLSLPWGVIWHPYQSGSIVAVGHCITSCLKTDFLCLPTTSKSLEMNVFVLPKPSWNTTSGRNRHQQNKFYGRRKVNQCPARNEADTAGRHRGHRQITARLRTYIHPGYRDIEDSLFSLSPG